MKNNGTRNAINQRVAVRKNLRAALQNAVMLAEEIEGYEFLRNTKNVALVDISEYTKKEDTDVS